MHSPILLSLLHLVAALPNWLDPRVPQSPPFTLDTAGKAHYTYAGVGPLPTIARLAVVPTPTTTIAPIKRHKCNRDNCLRSLLRKPVVGNEFCSKFLSGALIVTEGGSAVSGCKADEKRVSSACSCLSEGSASTVAPSSNATTSVHASTTGSSTVIPSSVLPTVISESSTSVVSSTHTPPIGTGTGSPSSSTVYTTTTSSSSPPYPVSNTTTYIFPTGTGTGILSTTKSSSSSSVISEPPYPTHNSTITPTIGTATSTILGTGYSTTTTTSKTTSKLPCEPDYPTGTVSSDGAYGYPVPSKYCICYLIHKSVQWEGK